METIVNVKEPKECCSTRSVLWYLVFTGFAVNYMIRLNLNIAIVSMIAPRAKNVSLTSECDIVGNVTNSIKKNEYTAINGTDLQYANLTSTEFTTVLPVASTDIISKIIDAENNVTSETSYPASPKRLRRDSNQRYFDWNEKEQGHILGSFFWLHWVTQIPGGILAAKYGTKMVFGLSNFLGVLGSFLIPWFAHRGTFCLVFIRIMQGLLCGFCWPSMHNMTAKWIPPNERSKFVTAYMGSSVGAGLTYPLCGLIIDKWGWEAVFYTSGAIGTIWFLAWLTLVYDTPAQHPRISIEEKQYILNSLGKSVSKKQQPTPWVKILTDKSVLANVVAQIGGIWGFFTLTVNGPSYFKFIHGWNIKATGLLSGMPHFLRIIFAYLFSTLGDYLLRSNKLQRTNVRKLAAFFYDEVVKVCKSSTISRKKDKFRAPYGNKKYDCIVIATDDDAKVLGKIILVNSPQENLSEKSDLLVTAEKQSKSCGFQGVFMLLLAYSGCNKIAAIAYMSLATAVNGAVSTGPLASLVDISPNYSAILLGICNTMVSIVGFITPVVVGYFTYQNQTTIQWQKVFWISSAFLFGSCIYYLIFVKSELASWNTPPESDTKETEMMVVKSNNETNKKVNSSVTEKIMYSNEEIF